MIPPTGFDRLREAGFTEEDIRNIRTQFHRLHGTTFEESPSEEARNLEEQWMDNTGETLPDGSECISEPQQYITILIFIKLYKELIKK
jgi:hypothetical protein